MWQSHPLRPEPSPQRPRRYSRVAGSFNPHEDVHLEGYADGGEAKAGIGAYFAFHFAVYNEQRLHQALGYRAAVAVWR